MTPIKALVTGARALLGQGIIRSLQASSLKPTIIGVDPSPLAAGLHWVDAAYLVPLAKAQDYLPRLKQILEHEKPDIVFVGTDVELIHFAQNRDALEAEFGTKIVVSSPEVIRIADDKWLTYQFLKEHGFPYPISALPEDVEWLIEKVGFPLVVKPRVGARSVGLHLVNSREELGQFLNADVVIQEHVGTAEDEYTSGVLVFGEARASIVMRRILRDGNTHIAFVDCYPELNAFVRKVGEALKAYGPINLQFRLTPQNEPKIFEINARYSGTTHFRSRAGFNEVEMVTRHLLYGEPITQPEITPCIILRYWNETVIHQSDVDKVRCLG